ncbi:hypothetical protein DPSP01_004175 [Paraphaeosphaeria sporulosa]
MATSATFPGAVETLSYQGDSGGTYNATLNREAFTLIAQNVTCAYPISDIYAPASRYLFYVLVVLTFCSIRIRWLSHVFFGAVVAYAACAAINAFIIIANQPHIQDAQNVTIPYISPNSNWTTGPDAINALVTNATTVTVKPDAVELDIDPITAIVVTACLVGLPLQIWSRTMRSSLIIRYMILLWNMTMLAASVCALLAWSSTNLAAPQYRFCFAGVLDPDAQLSDGWDPKYWEGSWNATIANIFEHPQTTWQELSNNCFYPCWNTSQVIRQRTSLKSVVSTRHTKFAKLHNPARDNGDDLLALLIYIAVWGFALAQIFLYLLSVLRLGSKELRATIHEPHHLWRKKGLVWRQLKADWGRSWVTLRGIGRMPLHLSREVRVREERPRLHDLVPVLRLLTDITALIILVAVFLLSPCIVVAFICWIEWYIRNDGSTNESINQVGQWAPLVSVAVVLLASTVYHVLKDPLANAHEIRTEIEQKEASLQKLREKLEMMGGAEDVEIGTPSEPLSRTVSRYERRTCSV